MFLIHDVFGIQWLSRLFSFFKQPQIPEKCHFCFYKDPFFTNVKYIFAYSSSLSEFELFDNKKMEWLKTQMCFGYKINKFLS